MKTVIFLALTFVSTLTWATEKSDWVAGHCSGCSVDAFDDVTFPDGLRARILSVGRNRVELTFFYRKGEFNQRQELNVGTVENERRELSESICRQFGQGFRINRVSYRLVYDTSTVGRAPVPSFETINVLVCKSGPFSFARPLEPTVNVNVAVPPVNIDMTGREAVKDNSTSSDPASTTTAAPR